MVKFYSLVGKKFVDIPESKCSYKIRNKRRFIVGKYKLNGKEYTAWKVLGMAKNKGAK